MEHISTYKTDLKAESIDLLMQLIGTESFSKQEDRTAVIIKGFLESKGVETHQHLNNIWAFNQYYDPAKPTVLLNSHHDTVKPNPQYTRDPFKAEIEDGKLYGLGSNDAGGPLVSLIATFLHFYPEKNLKYNLIISATAEEEISGLNGVGCILDQLPPIDFAIVGEPTLMDLAIAEKGLMVLDCVAHGKAGHAAREEGENAIYKSLKDIEWFQNYQFEKVSETLGPVKMSVTVIEAGKQHNVVPAQCHFTVDVRTTDAYTNEEVLEIIQDQVESEVNPRSVRLRPSSIFSGHPIVKAGIAMGKKTYGSPTTSDQALIPAPSLKLGPGDSARSHSANEFIFVEEIENGIEDYIRMLNQVIL